MINIKEDDVVDQMSCFKDAHNKTKKSFLGMKNISSATISNINNDNDNNNKQSEKASWWINELDSLGIKKNNYNKDESNYLQNLEDLSDNMKQDFIRNYICYSE